MTRLKGWLVNGMMMAVAVAVALFLTEGAIRLFYPQATATTHQDRYGLAMHWPGITRYFPQFGHDISFNAQGMRDREHARVKPPGTYRILVLGDSFMEAFQVPFEASLPSLLEAGLQSATTTPIEVINGGVSGWGTDDQLRYLTEYAAAWRPDLIVVAMTLHNDVSDNMREYWHTLRDGALVETTPEPKSSLSYALVVTKEFIASRFQLYRIYAKVRHRGAAATIGRNLNSHIVQLFRDPPPAEVARGYQLTELLLGRLTEVARGLEARVAVVMLPLSLQLTDESYQAFVAESGVPAGEMEAGRPQRLISAAGQSLGIPVIDLLPRFQEWARTSDEPLYIVWDGHWNAAGHRLASDVVVRGLLEAGLVP